MKCFNQLLLLVKLLYSAFTIQAVLDHTFVKSFIHAPNEKCECGQAENKLHTIFLVLVL